MVKIRRYEEKDYEEVVAMYYDLLKTIHANHKLKPMQYFYQNVLDWIDCNYDIMLTYDDTDITGFCLSYVDAMGGIVEDFYQGEVVYVKPQYRKGRSAYLQYTTVLGLADEHNMICATNASNITESSHISNKLGSLIYTHYERMPNGNDKK